MNKFETIYKTVFSIFGSDSWKKESIKVFPRGIDTSGEEFVILDIIPSARSVNKDSLNGIIILEIFVQGGEGPRRLTRVSDTLDNYLSNKEIPLDGNALQTYTGTLANIRNDSDSAMLRGTLTVPFNYFSLGN